MKKILAFFVMLCFTSVSIMPFDYSLEYLRSLEFPGKAKFERNQPGNQFSFGGFDFGKFHPDLIPEGLLAKMQSEILLLKETPVSELPNPEWDNGNFYFVGHSQGALRALAAAAWIKENEPELYNRLNGVITISGINRGFKVLEGGIPHIRARLDHDFQILYNGAASVQRAASGASLPLLMSAYTLIPAYRDTIQTALSFYASLPYLPDDLSTNLQLFSTLEIMGDYAYIVYAFSDREIVEFNDVVPGSNFINQYLVQSDGTSLLSRVQDGYRTVRSVSWERAFGARIIPRSSIVREPVYKLVHVPQTSGTLRFGEELPLGYLVSLNNDLFNEMRDNEKRIRETLKALQYILFSAQMIHTARTASLFGLFFGSPGSITDAANAHNYIKNFERQVYDILGSPENDGLIAKESQFFPESMHSNILRGSNLGVYESFSHHSHNGINDNRFTAGSETYLELERMVEAAISQRIRH